ncbi:MAG: Holliday junction DNA helicase RuvA [Candidatus Colwellbacteria bacterium RIFCSPLOWO2_12_FULL_44_13]|uniref:Holliday junction branch migration complex subunit RuvA n=3 Tax=Candidatus Colwelliibacteriota TaxID=1817904 RepID=A0A1G1Z997_9BACT|nr:MAG: Holliday junction DNA helicase RuvA [Candidatus Colwellbacteria bacterium RIFCSPHIGHO2_12_FULL_44_17]OGY60656.1 MAG: Holliday junction DNA helicase RuvA [Candidatus Colwellbacteria bacterium RIFCSPLOWO2_02_FULL_44_20b]OGY61497.1 MAG: Holliday junction DNA helicase RuvA [Candidatus Colwellbacteria bacterium RIFCSPLOWO2_12_FULL_44_13]
MFYTLEGVITETKNNWTVLEVGGIGYKVSITTHTGKKLKKGEKTKLYTSLYVRENALELYGFLAERELSFFESLNSVNGIGPKSAITIMSAAPIEKIVAAIMEGENELLTKSFGIGRKTAQRIILELRGKLAIDGSKGEVQTMKSDDEVFDALISLGYTKTEAKRIIERIDPKLRSVDERLRDALRRIK